MNHVPMIYPMKAAFWLSLALHGALIGILVLATVHRSMPPRQQIVEVILTEWPLNRSNETSGPTKLLRQSRPILRPQPKLENPPLTRPEKVILPEPFIPQSASPPISIPATSEVQSISKSSVEPSFDPPQFDAAYLHNPKPNYPVMARKLGLQGTVVVRVLIDPDGNPAEIRVEKSSGHLLLDESALDAVRAWRFEPAREGNLSIAAWVDVPIRFRLE